MVRSNPPEHISTDKVFDRLLRNGNITVVVGRRGSGKSSFGFSVAEYADKKKREVYIVGFPVEAKALFPKFINIVKKVEQVPNGSFALLDEAVLLHGARNWHKNHALTRIVDLARQKDLSLVFVTLNTAMIDTNILRAIDTLVLKEPSLLQEYMERPWFKKFLNIALEEFGSLPETEDKRSWCYIFDGAFEGMTKTKLPDFWSDELSKSWKDYGEENALPPGAEVTDKKMAEETLCRDCFNFAQSDDEAWCVLGHDVPAVSCEDFEKRSGNPKILKKADKTTKAKWVVNPPDGPTQCFTCIHCEMAEGGMPYCKRFKRTVRDIEDECPYKEVYKC